MTNEHEELLKFVDEEIVADLHDRGRKYIDHFSNIKMRYKKLALNWATAFILGLSYICIYDEQIIHISKYNIIAFSTIFTIFGMKLIQFLDINIGHSQLRNVFKYLLIYEKKETAMIWPYTKIEKLLYDKNFDPVFIDFCFYLSINFSIAVLGILALVFKRETAFFSSMVASITFISTFVIWQILTVIYLMRKRHKKE